MLSTLPAATDSWDAIFVGSGINALVGAVFLAKAGWKVCVLERNCWIGGNIRTAEVTEPGFLHDVYSGWHPLFAASEAYRVLKSDLQARGLMYLNTEYPTATLFHDGQAAFLSTSPQENLQHFETWAAGDGERWNRAVADFMARSDLGFGLLGTELWSWAGLRLLLRSARRFGLEGTMEFGSQLLSSSRTWLSDTFQSPRIHGLLAPWVLHTGLGPDSAGSGFMNLLIAVALQLGGMPIPQGGGAKLVDALMATIRDHGGDLQTGCHVDSVAVKDGCAVGVRAGGQLLHARRAVISSVNLAEVHSKLVAQGWQVEQAWKDCSGIVDQVVPFTMEQAKRTGRLVPITRSLGLSLGDRACLALALERDVPVYTADRSWKNLKLDLQIVVIR